jgi:PHS family inorganic phosphate transporter-like MFS transporter
MYGVELIIIIVGTVGQTLVGNAHSVSFWAVITFWRVLVGIGIGGDYPLSSVITAEFATTRHRGAMMSAVFAMQGIGQVSAALVGLITTAAYKSAIQYDSGYLDNVWRIVVGVGAIPACGALYYRLTIPETPRYTIDVENKIEQGANDARAFITTGARAVPVPFKSNTEKKDTNTIIVEQEESVVVKASFQDFKRHFGQWRYGRVLLGTSYSWFALDVAWYGLGLNNSIILSTIGFSGGSDPYE